MSTPMPRAAIVPMWERRKHTRRTRMGGNDPSYGGSDQPSNAMQAIDSDIGAPYIPADIVPGIDSILDPSF